MQQGNRTLTAMLAVSPEEVFGGFRAELKELIRDFTELHDIPVALILNGKQEYLSDSNRLSAFCGVLWKHAELRKLCLADHEGRSAVEAEDLTFTTCHAGLFNVSLSLDCGPLGAGALLAGQRAGTRFSREVARTGEKRYRRFLSSAASNLTRAELSKLEAVRNDMETKEGAGNYAFQADTDILFVRAFGKVIENYIRRRYAEQLEKISFDRGLARLLHEVANSSVYLDLNARGLLEYLPRIEREPEARRIVENSGRTIAALALESRYEVQNLLASLRPGDAADQDSWKGDTEPLDLGAVLRELWPAMRFLSEHEGKRLQFDHKSAQAPLAELTFPRIRGHRAMLLRAIFNVFSNALKYSYRRLSNDDQDRYISVRATPSYSSNRPLFALSFSSLGIAFASRREIQAATEYGFRGSYAVSERPIGSGIGLAEVQRIMRLHGGFVRITSNPIGQSPAHTVVWLVFKVPSGL